MNSTPQNPFARWTGRDVIDLIAAHPLAWVISPGAPLLSTPLPMLVESNETGQPARLIGHFAKRNPQVERLRSEPTALFLFTGPNAYISPELVKTTRDWGPTWNYAVVRILADVEFDESLNDDALGALVAKMEGGRTRPWTAAELGDRYEQLRARIIAFRAPIISCDATFKLGQDERPEILADILEAFEGIELGSWMRRFNADRL